MSAPKDQSMSHIFISHVERDADTGQREKAVETFKKAEGAFQEMGMQYWLRRTQEALERVQGDKK